MSWAQLAGQVDRMRQAPIYPLDARLDQIMAAQALPSGGIRGLPAVVGAQRLILSTIDQLILTTSTGQVPTWLRRPRRYGSTLELPDLLQYLTSSMLWHGTGYLWCTRVGTSWRIDPVHPADVHPERSTSGPLQLSFTMNGRTAPRLPSSPDDAVRGSSYLLHVPYMVTEEYPAGLSPLQAARVSLEGFARTEEKSWDTLDDGTHSGGRLETDQDLSPATAARYQDRWHAARNPADGRRRIPVLGSGLSYVNDLINPRDAQWIEARAFNQAVIYMMLGIPPSYMGASLVGGQSSLAYSNAQDNNRLFRKNAIEAFTQPLAAALSALLPPGRDETESVDVVFDFTAWEGTTDADPDA